MNISELNSVLIDVGLSTAVASPFNFAGMRHQVRKDRLKLIRLSGFIVLSTSVAIVAPFIFGAREHGWNNLLAAEIRQEMAEAYFAACKQMVASLEALKVFDRAAAGLTPDNEQIRRRSELLEEACERVHFVVIQREALQLSCLGGFFEEYEIPDEVRARMGPKRRR